MAQWMIYTKRADFAELAKKYNISPVTARIMINRGIVPEDFEEFLESDISKMHSPYLFKDMKEAVDILEEKLKAGKKIRIIGDYDIDGICSTYILTEAIRNLSGDVDMDIPDRVRDGYGINIAIVERALNDGVDTIITCDNGIAAIGEIEYAKQKGMTVIVTDHHEVPIDVNGEYLRVVADATINHKQPDCNYPFKHLCGAAVAYKYMQAVYERLGRSFDTDKYIVPAAIATIGDVVELTGENRTITKIGLEKIKTTKNHGINALIEVCGIDALNISSYHIGFVIGPCLNASGRLETAKKAYNLLNAGSMYQAIEIANELKNLNDKRKSLTEEAVEKAKALAMDKEDKNVLVIYVEGVHESIAGIVAGRVREAFYKPTIILTDSDEDGMIKGSGRSIEGYDMFKELSACRPLFTKFGGHPMAAGLSLKKENLDVLEESLNQNEKMTKDILTEKMWIDVKMPFSYISQDFVRELSRLEPFGKGNEKPTFAQKPVEVLSYTVMGKNNNVLKMTLRDDEGCMMDGIYFGDIEELENEILSMYGDEYFRRAKNGRDNPIRLSIAYYPQINSFRGRESIQIVIKQVIVV